MTTYNTGNPVGSTNPRDLFDNAQNIDEIANSTTKTVQPDRLGVNRKTLKGMGDEFDTFIDNSENQYNAYMSSIGYEYLGDYGAGISVTAANQIVRYDGEYWKADGSVLPFTTTGTWATDSDKFTPVGDAALRSEIGSGVRRVDSIAALRLISGRFANDSAAVLGYYTPGDGGGGPIRVWKTGAPGTYVDNGGSIILPTGGDGSGAWVWEWSGAVNVKWFGAKGDGTTTDDTVAIQTALDVDGDVWFPAARYIITDSLKLNKSKRITGEGGPGAAGAPAGIRTQCALLPRVAGNLSALGNYPVFINAPGSTGRQYNIQGFNIHWENVTPTDFATQGNRYGFKFVPDGVANYTAPYSTFTDIEVNGAWYIYYDNSDNYLNKFKSFLGRYNKYGFYKRLGTMMHFEECGNSIGDQGFFFENTVAPMLINCSADALIPDSSTPGLTANNFQGCNSVSIIGFDAEGADISGQDYSYMRFAGTTGNIQGWTGLENTLRASGSEFVSLIFVTNESNITISGFQRNFSPTTNYTFIGTSGTVATVRCTVNSKCVVIGSDVRAPTGGTPTNRYSLFGTGGVLTAIDSVYDNLNLISGVEISNGHVVAKNITGSGNLTVTGQLNHNVLSSVTRKVDSSGGAELFPSVFGDVPITGMLYAVEAGTTNRLIAAVYKANTAASPILTIIASSGLSVSATNAAGTINLSGATVGANVRQKVVIHNTALV